MSKKEVKDLAENAIDEKAEPKVIEKPVGIVRQDVVRNCGKFVVFPPSVTDQLHALTVADMVRQGQGRVEENELQNWTFQDGKDDGTLDAHSFQETVWADPAEQYESMQEIRNSATVVPRKDETVVEQSDGSTIQKDNYTVSDAKNGTSEPLSEQS